MAENWQGMRAPARWAWECWVPVRGQVHLLDPNAVKKEHRILVLDFAAVAAQMEWRGVPDSARADVWDLVLALHDFECHDGRGYERICYEHAYDDALLDPTCHRCRAWLGEELSDGAG